VIVAGVRKGRAMLRAVAVLVFLVVVLVASPASAAGVVGWTVHAVAEPSNFSSNNALVCESEEKCDRYQLLVMNVGDVASSGTVTVTDKLPPGITTLGTPESGASEETQWSCTEGAGNTIVTCTFAKSIPAGGYAPFLDIRVSAPSASMSGSLKNEVSVTGGGATTVVATSEETPISSRVPPFGVSEFSVDAGEAGGAPALQAGAHPWEITASFGIPASDSPPGNTESGVGGLFTPVENVKNIVVELPLGLVGDPQASPQCTQTELRLEACPAGSRVGAFGVIGDLFFNGEFAFTGEFGVSAIYNMVPEGGYPAEFGFTFANLPIYLYASVVHTGAGYRLRITTPGVPAELETSNVALTFFGGPVRLNGGSSEQAFLTNPADCSAGPLSSRIELESWGNPGHPVSREATVYPQLTGCALLQFNPSLTLEPSAAAEGGTIQADKPSGYTVDLKVPQTSAFSELATPELRDATVTLPQGVSVSPPVANGLVGCQAEGPEGINIGSGQIGPGGRDIGDPEATELGAGHAGGNGSPYDDGLYHTAHGHCPQSSTLGTVEIFTPLLANGPGESAPLRGHVYLAQPKCGGEGQLACTEVSATNGELFGLYIEGEGSGVVVKLPGTVSANPQTGQVQATFKENPQLPLSELKLHLKSGPRAPLANPQMCGQATTTSNLEPWSAPATPNATPSSSFAVTGCGVSMPFAPFFTAGTITQVADAFSTFTLTFSRHDGEQNLAGLAVNTPPGLLGMLSQVPLCGEPQAALGTCSSASRIGTTTVAVGAGEDPFVLGGQVYLTTAYEGAPFGLSIVVPANAGPFHLGNVVVRASIAVNPTTTALTVTSDPLPQSRDGVPFRLRTVNVTVNRPGFMFNPTNCNQQQISATITAAQGASAAVSSPFAVTGCATLPFKPSFSALTQAKTSRANGASLVVKITQKHGEANIQKVDVQLPKVLPARLTTLQKACTEAQFNANPAGCPTASNVGTATAITPVLNVPLTGPGYLVSHGGAAFPDLEFVLQGQGVQVFLDGKTDIRKGITYSKFETVPDTPIVSFETTLPEGPHSVLTANGNLCSVTETITVRMRVTRRIHGHLRHVLRKVAKIVPRPLSMPTTITGQNGAVIKQTTKIAVAGCPHAHKAKRPSGRLPGA
jgi:hypothetical protein